MDNRQKLEALKNSSVADAKLELPQLTRDELTELRALEEAEGPGKTRSTLLAAIDAALQDLGDGDTAGERGPNSTPDGLSTGMLESSDTFDLTNGAGATDAAGGNRQRSEGESDDTVGALPLYVTEDRCHEIVGEAVAAAMKAFATAQANGVSPQDGGLPGLSTSAPSGSSDADGAQAERERQAVDVEAQIKAGEEAERKANAARLDAERQRAEAAVRAYARATSGGISRYAGGAAIAGGRLFFSDGTRFLSPIGAIDVPAKAARVLNGKLVIDQAIDFDPSLPSAEVTEVWLEPNENDAFPKEAFAKCDIPGGLRIGGGHEAQLPAGHLAFELVG